MLRMNSTVRSVTSEQEVKVQMVDVKIQRGTIQSTKPNQKMLDFARIMQGKKVFKQVK